MVPFGRRYMLNRSDITHSEDQLHVKVAILFVFLSLKVRLKPKRHTATTALHNMSVNEGNPGLCRSIYQILQWPHVGLVKLS